MRPAHCYHVNFVVPAMWAGAGAGSAVGLLLGGALTGEPLRDAANFALASMLGLLGSALGVGLGFRVASPGERTKAAFRRPSFGRRSKQDGNTTNAAGLPSNVSHGGGRDGVRHTMGTHQRLRK